MTLASKNIRGQLVGLLVISLSGLFFAPPAAATHPPASCLDTEAETATNTTEPTGGSHTLTATLRSIVPSTCTGSAIPAVAATTINFEIVSGPSDSADDDTDAASPDFTCQIAMGASVCSGGYVGGTSSGTDVIRSWVAPHAPDASEGRNEVAEGGSVAEPDETDVVEKQWQGAPTKLDCDDESGDDRETNPDQALAQSTETYTCTVTDSTNAPVSGVSVQGENRNTANDPDDSSSFASPDYLTCTTAADGKCQLTVSQTNNTGGSGLPQTGIASICFWAGNLGDGPTLCASEPTDETENNDLADQVEKTWLARSSVGGGIDAEAETMTTDTNKSQTITVTIYDQFGSPFQTSGVVVNFEYFQFSPTDSDGNTPGSPDATCTTVGQACSFSYSSASAGNDLICAWTNTAPTMTGNNTNGTCDGEGLTDADDAGGTADAPEPASDDVDVVERVWLAAAATEARRLDCGPEQETTPTGTTRTVSCTATNISGQGIANANLDIELVGANDPDSTDTPQTPDYTCNTAAGGTCVFSHGPAGQGTTTAAGTTIYKVWIDEDGQNTSTELDTTEGRDEATSAGSKPEIDGTDVVEKLWTAEVSSITITPNADTANVGDCNPFTLTAKNAQQQVTVGAVLDIEQIHQNATNTTLNDEPTVAFCTPSSGANPSPVDDTKGDLRPPQETPDNPGTAGGETSLGTDVNGQVTIGIKVTATVGSSGAGDVTVTAFTDPNENDDRDQTEAAATATKTWVSAGPGGRTIDCQPDAATTPITEDHTVICTVKDAAGAALSGVSVTFSEDGQGDLASEAQNETGSNGEASVVVSSDAAGAETITGAITNSQQNEPDTDECDKAAGDPSGAPAGDCSDTVSNTWTDTGQPECSDGDDNDNDGDTDFPDDDGCESADDDSEGDKCPGLENVSGNHIVGTAGDDTLNGTSDDDVICGLGGNDEINGLDGDDLLIGGDGDDTVSGGDGADDLKGDGGNDVLKGETANDDLSGGTGNDRLSGGGGNDSLLGEGGNDSVKGGGGVDFLSGAAGKDKVFGGGGDDSVNGGGANDSLRGDAGNDQLKGGGGRDICDGGSGRDRCLGGPGKDKIKRCETGDNNTRRKQLVR